jgi:hypothetical protein
MADTTTTTSFQAPSARQRQLIADLARELGREIEVPKTRKAASAVIAKAIAELGEAQGGKLAPTSKQVRLLERLGKERGREYKLPATRNQASARIKQILGAQRPQQEATAAAA